MTTVNQTYFVDEYIASFPGLLVDLPDFHVDTKVWLTEEMLMDVKTVLLENILTKECLLVNSATAEVMWTDINKDDPYGVYGWPFKPSDILRTCFARRPGGDVWVWLEYLPEDTKKSLEQKHKMPYPDYPN